MVYTKFSELIPSIHSSQKFIVLEKTNMSISMAIILRSTGFRELIYLIPCF